jgi:hypothetical protein
MAKDHIIIQSRRTEIQHHSPESPLCVAESWPQDTRCAPGLRSYAPSHRTVSHGPSLVESRPSGQAERRRASCAHNKSDDGVFTAAHVRASLCRCDLSGNAIDDVERGAAACAVLSTVMRSAKLLQRGTTDTVRVQIILISSSIRFRPGILKRKRAQFYHGVSHACAREHFAIKLGYITVACALPCASLSILL